MLEHRRRHLLSVSVTLSSGRSEDASETCLHPSSEVLANIQVSPNTEREYRRALAAEGLLDGEAGDVPPLEVLRATVERHLPVVAPPQMVSTAEPMGDRIVELAKLGLKPQAIYDRLRLEDPNFTVSFWAVRGAWRTPRGSVHPAQISALFRVHQQARVAHGAATRRRISRTRAGTQKPCHRL